MSEIYFWNFWRSLFATLCESVRTFYLASQDDLGACMLYLCKEIAKVIVGTYVAGYIVGKWSNQATLWISSHIIRRYF